MVIMELILAQVETKGPGKGKAFRKSLWRENKKNAMQVEVLWVGRGTRLITRSWNRD